MKSRIEDAWHIRVVLKHGYNEPIITQLRDIAIELLCPVIAKVPRHFSDEALAAYKAKNISTEWNLTTTDAYEFFHVSRNYGLTKRQQSAVALLYFCTTALEAETLSDNVMQNILDAYAGLDIDDAIKGGKFRPGREEGSIEESTAHIFELAKNNRSASAKQLFALADKTLIEGMAESTFANHVSKARKEYQKIKSAT